MKYKNDNMERDDDIDAVMCKLFLVSIVVKNLDHVRN